VKPRRASTVLLVAIMFGLTLPAQGRAQAGNNAAVEAYNRGTDLLNARRYREAIPHFDEAIRLNPRYAQAYHNRGVAYRNLGQHQRAIQDYDQAIRLNPRYAEAYNNRGLAYENLGQHQRAIQDYDEAIRINSRLVEPYHNRGTAYHSLGQYQRAIQDYDQAIAINPRLAPPYGARGIAELYLHRNAAAESDFKKAFELDPSLKKTFESLTKEAKAKRQAGPPAKSEASAANPFDEALRLQKAGRHEEAIPYYDEAIRGNPKMDEAYYRRGLAYSNLNQYQRAIQDFDEAIRLNPRVAETYTTGAALTTCLGNISARSRTTMKPCGLIHNTLGPTRTEVSPSSICAETLRQRLISKKPSALIRR
jgi:tetratricopeptide (TPR) repeat protein